MATCRSFSHSRLFVMIVLLLVNLSPTPLTATGVGPPYGLCPFNWQAWGDSCYMNRMFERQTWYDAKTICQTLGGNLATPNSKPEHDFIWEKFRSSFPDRNPGIGFWIDCTDVDMEGVWVCLGDGDTALPYRPGWLTEPPNHDALDCAAVSYHYLYNDVSCYDQKYVLCKRPAPPRCTQSSSCYAVTTEHCLLNYTINTAIIEHPAQCCIACNASPECRSFNVVGNKCQLNNATRFTVDRAQHFKEEENCIYYEL